MFSTLSKTVMVAGAAALLSSQAAYAAPTKSASTVDPLVALSILGTSQSRAAVCATDAGCGLSAVAPSPALTTAASAAAVQGDPPREESKGVHMILLIGGAMILIAVLAAALAGNEDSDAPVSPA